MTTAEAFQLRDYHSSDLTRLSEIGRECFPPEIACAAAQLRAMMGEERGFAIVAEVEDEGVVGFVIASKIEPKLGHIVSLDVLPRFRRRGIGTSLMGATGARLAALGAETLRLETPESSQGAQQLYRKLGFCHVGFIEGYYSDGARGWVMEKPLAATVTAAAGR